MSTIALTIAAAFAGSLDEKAIVMTLGDVLSIDCQITSDVAEGDLLWIVGGPQLFLSRNPRPARRFETGHERASPASVSFSPTKSGSLASDRDLMACNRMFSDEIT